MKIKSREIGRDPRPYISAEIGVNHGGSMELAKRQIREAAEGGASAAKFQSYKAETIASKKNSPAYWDLSKEATTSQFELVKKYDCFGPEEYRELAACCNEAGVDFLSTPFDLAFVDVLDPLVPVFKIASADITNVPLLRKVAKTGKPVMLSTGASTLPEVEYALNILKTAGSKETALLHCVLNYPTKEEDAQLGMINTLKRVFPDCLIGYSDHVVPDETISSFEAALLMGAVILEKHFTHDKTLPGNDHYHAMDKTDLARFCAKVERYRRLTGPGSKDLAKETGARLHARRSIFTSRPIKTGELFTEENLIAKRPGHGISPLFWDEVIGKRAASDIGEDELILWKHLG